jgi:hypothetical protein
VLLVKLLNLLLNLIKGPKGKTVYKKLVESVIKSIGERTTLKTKTAINNEAKRYRLIAAAEYLNVRKD